MIEIRIGVLDSTRELILEIDEDNPEVVQKTINGALESDGALWLTDRRGKRVGIPISKLAYVELSPEAGPRAVGFGSHDSKSR